MTANPLRLLQPQTQHGVSGYTAAEWAQMARDKGLTAHAKAWEDAARDGWDDRHFSLTRGDELAQK
jgi:hypothetical protein